MDAEKTTNEIRKEHPNVDQMSDSQLLRIFREKVQDKVKEQSEDQQKGGGGSGGGDQKGPDEDSDGKWQRDPKTGAKMDFKFKKRSVD